MPPSQTLFHTLKSLHIYCEGWQCHIADIAALLSLFVALDDLQVVIFSCGETGYYDADDTLLLALANSPMPLRSLNFEGACPVSVAAVDALLRAKPTLRSLELKLDDEDFSVHEELGALLRSTHSAC